MRAGFGYFLYIPRMNTPDTKTLFLPSNLEEDTSSVYISPSDWLFLSASACHSPVGAAQLDGQPGRTLAVDEMRHPHGATSPLKLCETNNKYSIMLHKTLGWYDDICMMEENH